MFVVNQPVFCSLKEILEHYKSVIAPSEDPKRNYYQTYVQSVEMEWKENMSPFKESSSCMWLPSPRSIMAKTALQLASPSSLVATHVYKPASLMRQSRIHSPPESWPSDGSRGSSLWYQVNEGLGYPVTDTLSRMSQLVPTAALRSLRLKTGGSCIAASEKIWSPVTLGPSRLRLDPGPSAISISVRLLWGLYFLSGNWLGDQARLQLLKASSERLHCLGCLWALGECRGC